MYDDIRSKSRQKKKKKKNCELINLTRVENKRLPLKEPFCFLGQDWRHFNQEEGSRVPDSHNQELSD